MIRSIFITILISGLSFSSELSIFGNLSSNNLQNDPEKFLGIVDCGDYTDYQSNSENLFLKYNYTFYDQLGFYFSLGFNSTNYTYENVNKFSTRSDISKQEVSTINKVDFKLSHLTSGIGLSYRLENLITGPFRIDLGANYFIMSNSNFNQKEEILSPDNATFIRFNNSQVRDIATGEVSTHQNSINLNLVFINYINILDRLSFNQSLGIRYQLNSSISDAITKVYGFSAGIGFTYDLRKKETEQIIQEIKKTEIQESKPKEIVINEIKPINPKPELNLDINSKWEDESVLESGEELLATLPLVNSVFFEKNSSKIPKEYIRQSITKDYYFGDVIEVHKNVISRIENILTKNPKATIEILGYSAGNENEKNALKLAEERANNLKSIFIEKGINKDRIKTNSYLLPLNPTSMSTIEGIEENMRADIILKDAQFQEFVALQNFQNLKGIIDCQVSFSNIEDLKLKSNLSDSIISVENDNNYSIEIDHRIGELKSIDYAVDLFNGDTSISKKENIDILRLDQKNVEFDLSRFEAILRFDFNSSKLSNDNKMLLSQLVEKLPDSTRIQILGSADNLGNKTINEALEEARAKNTRDYLRSISDDKFEITTGRSKQKFPEDSPQGRFLNRSIRIRVSR